MTMDEVRAAFARCEEDPTIRSLKAVLTIGHAQIAARGRLVTLRNAALASGVAAGVALIASAFLPARFLGVAKTVQVAAALVCLGAAALVWKVRGELERAAAEEREIRLMVAATARRISASANFFAQPLSVEQRATLRDSIRATDGDDALESLLSVH